MIISNKMKKAVLILDCGATNVKTCLVDTTGNIISSYSLPNETIAVILIITGGSYMGYQ